MITIRDIRKGHPFGVPTSTDKDYADIANTIVAMLRYTPFCAERSEDELKRIALKLTLYFEDMVSEIGLWHSFVQKHLQLYGKPLPFYNVEKDYTPDEPHIEDIQLLLWDSTLDDEYSDTLVNPENEAFYRNELKMPKGSKAPLPRGVKNIILFIPNLAEGKLCTIMDCAEYICHPDNPMYNREKSKTHFLISDLDLVPGEFIRYAIANNLMPDFALNSNRGYIHGRKLAQDNLDFLARTLRRQDY